jgi:hypothetical protein
MYCSSCGTQLQGSAESCSACGKSLRAQQDIDLNAKALEEARAHLDSQQWPFYGFTWGLVMLMGSFFVFDEGFAWGGWAPDWVLQWLLFISTWVLVLGTSYGIGHTIDDSKLQGVKPGDSFRLTSWRFILCTLTGVGFAYFQLDTGLFF